MSLTEQDRAAILAALDADVAAVRRGDWDAVTRMFTADAVRFPPHQAPLRGRDAIREWLGGMPAIVHFALTADEIDGGDGVAFVRGAYAITVEGPDGTRQQDEGHYMGLVRRQPDGSWLWTSDMIASTRPAAAAG